LGPCSAKSARAPNDVEIARKLVDALQGKANNIRRRLRSWAVIQQSPEAHRNSVADALKDEMKDETKDLVVQKVPQKKARAVTRTTSVDPNLFWPRVSITSTVLYSKPFARTYRRTVLLSNVNDSELVGHSTWQRNYVTGPTAQQRRLFTLLNGALR